MNCHQMILERRDTVSKLWSALVTQTPPMLLAKLVERSKTELPPDFLSWAPGVGIASEYLLQAAGHFPGAPRPDGWCSGNPDVFTKIMWQNRLTVRGCGEYWTVERDVEEVLAFPYVNVPVFTETCEAAMRLAEYCHPGPQEGERFFPRPRGVASGLRWVVRTPTGIEWC
jgi:hypothetical protein